MNIVHTPLMHFIDTLVVSVSITIVTIIFARFQLFQVRSKFSIELFAFAPLVCHIEKIVLIAIYLSAINCFIR